MFILYLSFSFYIHHVYFLYFILPYHSFLLISQAEVYPDEWVAMKSIKAKFISSTKTQTEQIISNSHPYLKLEA